MLLLLLLLLTYLNNAEHLFETDKKNLVKTCLLHHSGDHDDEPGKLASSSKEDNGSLSHLLVMRLPFWPSRSNFHKHNFHSHHQKGGVGDQYPIRYLGSENPVRTHFMFGLRIFCNSRNFFKHPSLFLKKFSHFSKVNFCM